MKVLVSGATGFVGRRLIARLAELPGLPGPGGQTHPIDDIVAVDVVPPDLGRTNHSKVTVHVADVAEADVFAHLVDDDVGAIFHLSGVVSAGAEADFDLGYRVNLGGLQSLIACCRRQASAPRLIFTSSIAVYGGVENVTDDTRLTPLTSYGAQKAMCELLINDATRKGYIDGRSLRLSAVVARPGAPNAAASGFTSSIVREPLAGRKTICPVAEDVPLPMISPGRVVDALVDTNAIDAADLGSDRSILLGAISPTGRDVVDALSRIAGPDVAALVRFDPDPAIVEFVEGWPQRVAADRASRFGLEHDGDVDAIIRAYIDDELGGDMAGG